MKSLLIVLCSTVNASVVLFCSTLRAAPITDWHTFKAAPATTLSGQGTSSPVLGSTTVTAATAFLVGYFDTLSLTNQGDRITLNFQASFNDAAGIATAGDQFRFGLFDIGTSAKAIVDNTASAGVAGQTDNWLGYRFGIKSGTGTGSGGSIRERGTGADLNPMANAQSLSLGVPAGDQLLWSGAVNGVGGALYSGAMTLERTPTGVALAGYFRGNGTTNFFAANDDTIPSPLNYSSVCYLNGNALSCDQILFQNVSIQYGFSNALQITSAPINQSVFAGQSATFTVAWSGSGVIPFVQWKENNVDIPNATNASYTTPPTLIAQNGNTFSVVVSNVFGSTVSGSALLTVLEDTNAPIVLSVSSLLSNVINVVFSEPVDPVSAQNGSNYELVGNTFSIPTLLPGGTNVQITLDNPITGNYMLRVTNVTDIAGNPLIATNAPGVAHGFEASVGIGAVANTLGFALNEKVVLYSDGLNIFDAQDNFEYVYKPISGDFDLAVRVESLLVTDQNARAGLMARLDIGPSSRNVLIEATPARFIFQYRTNAGEATLTVPSPRPPTAFPNCWLRLTRQGSMFTAFSSTNYGVWDLIGSHDTAMGTEGVYPATILIGLAASAGNANSVTRAQFSGFGRAVLRPTLAIAHSSTDVEVSWPITTLGFTLEAAPALINPITWTNVPGSTTTNRVFVPIGPSPLFFRAVLE